MTVERDDLNGAEHEVEPTHRLEDMDVYKVDLVKRPATGDVFLAVRSEDVGGDTVPKRRSAMSTEQFRQQYRPEDGTDSVTIAQRGDPVSGVQNQPGVIPKTEEVTLPVQAAEQGVQRESNQGNEGNEMTQKILERMDTMAQGMTALTAGIAALVNREATATAAPAPEVAPVVDTAAPATTEPEVAPVVDTPAPAPEVAPVVDTAAPATTEPEVAPVATEPAPADAPAAPATTDTPTTDTAAVERMTANMDTVTANMEAVARGVEATSAAVVAMGGQVSTIATSVASLAERMGSVERGMTTSNAAPQDETEPEANDQSVERGANGKGGTFKGLLFGPRVQ